MEDKIKNLIEFQKTAKQECWEYLNELNQLDVDKMSPEEKENIKFMVLRATEEHAWRSVFINQLEDLL